MCHTKTVKLIDGGVNGLCQGSGGLSSHEIRYLQTAVALHNGRQMPIQTVGSKQVCTIGEESTSPVCLRPDMLSEQPCP